jgi:ATP-dependent Lon protease
MDSMPTLPLFPLQIVQFPGVVTPLHIFETRYRKMLKDIIAGDKTFGIVAVMDDATARPLLGSVGCTAKVIIAQEMDDGRSNVLCVGEQRFRLLDYEEGEPYLQARVEFFEDETAFEDFSEETAEAKELFTRIAKLARQLKENEREEEELPELPDDPQDLSFMLAAYLDLMLTEKQELVELTDTGERLRRVMTQLREMVDDYEKRLRGRKISKVNGHGGKLPDF